MILFHVAGWVFNCPLVRPPNLLAGAFGARYNLFISRGARPSSPLHATEMANLTRRPRCRCFFSVGRAATKAKNIRSAAQLRRLPGCFRCRAARQRKHPGNLRSWAAERMFFAFVAARPTEKKHLQRGRRVRFAISVAWSGLDGRAPRLINRLYLAPNAPARRFGGR